MTKVLIVLVALLVACANVVQSAADLSDSNSVIIYTTGGQGFHRQLVMHLPIVVDSNIKNNKATTTLEVPVTFQMKLRNTFFIDVAEAENLWDAKILNSNDMPLEVPKAVSRGGNGCVKSVKLQHPIQTRFPYDIEAPTVKTPYLFNNANVTFVFTIDPSLLTRNHLAVLSIPIHERYEDVSLDPAQTHVERCIPAEDIKLRVEGKGKDIFSYLEDLPVHFTQTEDTSKILANVALGGRRALSTTTQNGEKMLSEEHFCVRVPVGYIGDLPTFYWSTMGCMILGAVAVWAGLTFV